MKNSIKYADLTVVIVGVCTCFLTSFIGDMSNNILAASILTLALIKKKFSINLITFFITTTITCLIVVTLHFNVINLLVLFLLYEIQANGLENNTIKLYLKVITSCFCIIVFMYFVLDFNITNDTTIWRYSARKVFDRKALGYIHPNMAATKWFAIVLCWMLLCNKKKMLKDMVGVLLITYIMYRLTYSRTTTYLIFLVCGSYFILRKKLDDSIPKIFQRILGVVPCIFIIVSLLLAGLSNNLIINEILSGRLVLYNSIIKEYGLSMFGNSAVESALLDNGYLHMLLAKGIIYSIVFLLLFFYVIKKNCAITYRSLIIIGSYFVMALMETSLFRFELLTIVILTLCNDAIRLKEKNSNEKLAKKHLNIFRFIVN